MTALCIAMERRSTECEKLLKKMGSDMNRIDEVPDLHVVSIAPFRVVFILPFRARASDFSTVACLCVP